MHNTVGSRRNDPRRSDPANRRDQRSTPIQAQRVARVTASGMDLKPFKKPITASWNQIVPRSEIAKILAGFRPSQMEDRWVVYADGPDQEGRVKVHLHRSWTGMKIAEVKMVTSVDVNARDGFAAHDARFTKIKWESKNEDWGGETEQGVKDLVKNVLRGCARVDLP